MEIFGMEKMSLVDYDGLVATTIFTGSCNFMCEFCHNSPLVLHFKNLPVIPEEEVLSYLKKRRGIIDGVCVSGGEPTLQKDLPSFIEKVKNLGYKVKLDTNGTAPALVKTLHQQGLVDYFAMDIKNDRANYGKIIGIDGYDTKKVESTIDYFFSSDADYEFRTTLIEKYHKEENIRLIGEWIKGAKKYFLQKFKDGEGCIVQGLKGVEKQVADKFIDILKENIPNTHLRGY